MLGIVIAGTHSGCGKTTVTLGILAALRKKGLTVQPFKTGPDFIDTGLHKLITGRTSRNLDLWMCGRDYVTDCFSRHSQDADISVVEGVMGMYDGNISTADLAVSLGLPVILVVDAYGMAESAGAIVAGFRGWGLGVSKRPTTNAQPPSPSIAGVIFNRIASDRHYKRVKDSVQDVPVLGYLPRDLNFEIPHRHLGLTVAEEEPISAEAIDRLAGAVLRHIDIEKMIQDTGGKPLTPNPQPLTPAIKIAVAYDKAFCFYYEDNLDLLRQAGAEIVTFSPISDSAVPNDADALYVGGGYPELHAEKLSANKPMLESIKKYSDAGMPIYAECGGLMYLTEGIYDFENVFHPMAGVFPFKTIMKKGRASLGYREALLKERAILGNKGSVIRGHEFHYSEVLDSRGEVVSPLHCTTSYSVKDGSGQSLADEGYRMKNTLGSYIHIHFGSNLSIANSIIDFIKECHGKDHYCGTR
ncbi:MAG: cobyrinate a,c-diamide synthase [Nitrospirae bacterium]|nr:cobyrinate a,c-diamide synthase [Nitrospirota bacterium]